MVSSDGPLGAQLVPPSVPSPISTTTATRTAQNHTAHNDDDSIFKSNLNFTSTNGQDGQDKLTFFLFCLADVPRFRWRDLGELVEACLCL